MERDSPENGSSFNSLPPVDLLGQDGRPSTDGGLLVLLMVQWERKYSVEFEAWVEEAAQFCQQATRWVSYGESAAAVGGGGGGGAVSPHIDELSRVFCADRLSDPDNIALNFGFT